MAARIFEFGEFQLDSGRFELSRAGRQLKLERKPMELLILLMSRHGDLVTRSEIAEALWEPGVFVDIEHGINTAVRKIRYVLKDDPLRPRYVQTVSGKGYRFVPDVGVGSAAREIPLNGHGAVAALPAVEPPANQSNPLNEPPLPYTTPTNRRPARPHGRLVWLLTGAACISAAIALSSLFWMRAHRPVQLEYTQLTDFTDSAVAPTLSADGRLLAFFRDTSVFTSSGPVYVKMLPTGKPRRVTDDPRDKYALAFSPDGSEIAYTVLTPHEWVTYAVSVFGGEPRLLLQNAAGLTWLDRNQLLFSQARSGGLHLGVVTGTATRGNFRELYFPAHERGMAHYSYASPDRKSALVVEMNGDGDFASCRLISMNGRAPGRLVGPSGACLSAGWSPDGSWMYFTVYVDGRSHLWRQRFPDGAPEQLTFGPTEEDGVAVDPDGKSLITSLGVHESAVWMHDANGERSLESEGEVMDSPPPIFNRTGTVLYYLLRSNNRGPELWRMNVQSGASEALTPGVPVIAFDISPDEKEVVYSTLAANGRPQLWLAPVDRRSPPQPLGKGGETSPYFGPRGQILFLRAEGKSNYLEQSNRDGSNPSKVVPYTIDALNGISPGRHWITAARRDPQRNVLDSVLIPVDGGSAPILCDYFCGTKWSTNGNWLFIEGVFEHGERGRSLAIPVGPGEHPPDLPPTGLPLQAQASAVPGAVSVARDDLIPGKDPAHFAYVNTTVHRNLYRISLR